MVIQFVISNFLGSFRNRVMLFSGDNTLFGVHVGCRELNQPKGTNQRWRNPLATDREVSKSTGRGGPIVGRYRNLHLTHRIGFGAEFSSHSKHRRPGEGTFSTS